MKSRTPIARWAALAGLLALCHAPVMAGRPFTTDDAGVVSKGSCEVEAFSEWLRPSEGPNESGLTAQLGCGILGATQLAFALATSRSAGERSRAMVFSGKTKLVDGGQKEPSFALAYFTSRDRSPTESWRSGASGAIAAITAPMQGWLLHANLGVTAERAPSRNVTGWALALERPSVVDAVDAGFEFFGDDRNTHWVQVAARWHVIPDRLLFDASLGRQTSGGRADRLSVGLKWAF